MKKFKEMMLSGVLLLNIVMSNPIFSSEMTDKVCQNSTDKKCRSKNWNSEFYNKSGKKIEINILGSASQSKENILLPNKKLRISDFDVENEINIAIKEIGSDGFYVEGSDTYYKIVSNTERSTVYVTFGFGRTGKLIMYPQTGTAFGFLGKTDSGLSLNKSKNVKFADIKNNADMPLSLKEKIKAQFKAVFGAKKR